MLDKLPPVLNFIRGASCLLSLLPLLSLIVKLAEMCFCSVTIAPVILKGADLLCRSSNSPLWANRGPVLCPNFLCCGGGTGAAFGECY